MVIKEYEKVKQCFQHFGRDCSKLLSVLQSEVLISPLPFSLIFSKNPDSYSVLHLQLLKSHQVNFIKQKCAFAMADR